MVKVALLLLLALPRFAAADPKVPCYTAEDFAGVFKHRVARTDKVTLYKKGAIDLVGEFTWFDGAITGYLFAQLKKAKDSDLCPSALGTFSAKDRSGKRSTGTIRLVRDGMTPGFGRTVQLDDLRIEFTVEGTSKVEYWIGNRI